MKMKSFDLEAAKRGEPICTRDGREATFVAYFPYCRQDSQVVTTIANSDKVFLHYPNGAYWATEDMPQDLFMVDQTKTVWANIYADGHGQVRPTKEGADRCADPDRVACVEVEYTPAPVAQPKREAWLNIYLETSDGSDVSTHFRTSKEAADRTSDSGCIACVRIEY